MMKTLRPVSSQGAKAYFIRHFQVTLREVGAGMQGKSGKGNSLIIAYSLGSHEGTHSLVGTAWEPGGTPFAAPHRLAHGLTLR